jgi:hypothetical protein
VAQPLPDVEDLSPEGKDLPPLCGGAKRPIDVRPVAGIPPEVAEVTLHECRPAGADLGSTSHDGWYLWLRPVEGVRVAGDLEALDNPAALRMAARFGIDTVAFLRFWTLLETIAKLKNVPADSLLRQYRAKPHASVLEAAHPDVSFITGIHDGYMVTVGWIPPECRSAE